MPSQASVYGCLLSGAVRIPPGACVSVSFKCCVLSGKCLCVGLLTSSEESYRLWCVWVWSEASIMRMTSHIRSCCNIEKNSIVWTVYWPLARTLPSRNKRKIEKEKGENQIPEPNVLGVKGDMCLRRHDNCIHILRVIQCVHMYIIKPHAMCSTEKQGCPVSKSSIISLYFYMSSNRPLFLHSSYIKINHIFICK